MSLRPPSFGNFFPFAASACFLLLPLTGFGQTGGNPRGKETPGVALVKPQPWSADDLATALEFVGFSDHSGYYEFRTAKSSNLQVSTSKIVKLVIYPESQQSISTAEQRAAIQKTLEEFAALSTKYPSVARQLEKAGAPLKADAAKYDSGNVKDDGQWLARSTYYRQKAAKLADLLRPELTEAPNIKEVDLTTNQYYLGLQDLAKAEPSVTSVVDSMRSLYQSLVRKADRDALLNQLNSPGLVYDHAVDLVKQLKALQPVEDARASLFVQSWDNAVASAGRLTTQITDTQTEFENAMPATDDSGNILTIPGDLSEHLDKLSESLKAFRAGSPSSAIRAPLQLGDALVSCGEKFPGLAKQIQAREYLDAKSVLEPLTNQADLIGPKTSKALAGLQKKLSADIQKFQTLRNEAKMLSENQKVDEAVKKYQEAYEIIPAKDVAAQIDALKKK